jgi:hypothetical protein
MVNGSQDKTINVWVAERCVIALAPAVGSLAILVVTKLELGQHIYRKL